MQDERRVCANCRVLVEPDGAGWRHPAELVEKFSRSTCAEPSPGRIPSGSEARFGLARAKSRSHDKLSLHATLDDIIVEEAAPVTVAVDGSYKLTITEDKVVKPMSWSYLATNGRYGLGTALVPGKVVGGDEERKLQCELRALAAAVDALKDSPRLIVLTDCANARSLATLWQQGHDVMPGGYDTVRASGRESTLARLARQLREGGDRIELRWVRGHAGHPLNEGADQLAKMARSWAVGLRDRDDVAAAAPRTVRHALTSHATGAFV